MNEFRFLKMVKKYEFYLIEKNGILYEILYKKNRLSNSTFIGWFPVGCFTVNNQVFLVKFTVEKEWVLWELNQKYEYIGHKHTIQEISSYKGNFIDFIEFILNPLDIINKEISNSYKMDFFLNSLNLDLVLPNWIKCINLDKNNSFIQLLEANINIKNIHVFFDSVSYSFSKNNYEVKDGTPYDFLGNNKKIAYQESALIDSEFYVADIFSDEDILVNRSVVLTDQKIAFFCKSKLFPYYIFSSGELGIFTHIYIPRLNLVIYKYSNHKKDGALESRNNIKLLLSRALKIENFNYKFSGINKMGSCLVTGSNRNSMYHLLVNDLSGIDRIYKYLNKGCTFNVASTKAISLLGLNNKFIEKSTSSFCSEIFDLDSPSAIDILNNKCFCTFLRSNFYVTERIRKKIVASIVERANPLQGDWNDRKILLIGIRAGRRRWLNQVEGIASLINKINKKIPDLLVIFDGTGSVEFDSNNDEYINLEKIIVKSILERIDSIDNISLIGKPVFLSIYAALKSSFYISPWGAGLTKYQILADKVGIVHTNKTVIESFTKRYYFWERDNMPNIYYSDPIKSVNFKANSVDTPKDSRPDWKLFDNYQIDEENIFELVKKLL